MGYKNCEKLHSFISSVWPGRPIWNRDIDTHAPPEVVSEMARITETVDLQARDATFARFEGTLFSKVRKTGPTRTINPIGIFHRKRTLFGLQWCPHCLREDVDPYFRLHWRLSLFSTCHRHGVILHCECERCGSPAAPHRSSDQTCHDCGTDRRVAKAKVADPRVLQLEGLFYSILYENRPTVIGQKPVHPLVYFSIVSRLHDLLVGNARAVRLRKIISNHNSLPQVNLEHHERPMPEYLKSTERHGINLHLHHLLLGWPWMFIGYCQESRMLWTWVTKDRKLNDLPFPMVDIADKYLFEPLFIRKAVLFKLGIPT